MKDLGKTAFSPQHTQKRANIIAFVRRETPSLQPEG